MIDDDQGKSEAYSANCSGFRDLMARIAAGEAGIVLSLEVSRLARDKCDRGQLLQVACIADTLILEESGVHRAHRLGAQLAHQCVDRRLAAGVAALAQAPQHF